MSAACVSIIIAVFLAMIGIGITKLDACNILAVRRPGVPFVKDLGPVLNIVLACSKRWLRRFILVPKTGLIKVAGHVAFISFQSELADLSDFMNALLFE